MTSSPTPQPAAIVVFLARREATCDRCREQLPRGGMIRVEGGSASCLECADLDHLWFLSRGDAALTRRAAKHSGLSAVVVRWSTSRKRYERQGLLVEEPALHRAEEECLADADRRDARRQRAEEQRAVWDQRFIEDFALAISRRLPGCPPEDALLIARRACERRSGRIGRTEAGRSLADEAIDLAVRAHVRHRHTQYDSHLMDGWDRDHAREAVGPTVDEIMARWSVPAGRPQEAERVQDDAAR